MSVVWIVLGSYFGLGVLALIVLDWTTGRVRKKLRPASSDTQQQLATSGTVVGNREALVLVVLALWLFWPAAVYGALSSLWRGDGKKR